MVKKAANYAKIDKVCRLNEGFQQVSLVQKFRNFPNIVIENQLFKTSEEKRKLISNKTKALQALHHALLLHLHQAKVGKPELRSMGSANCLIVLYICRSFVKI